MPALLMSTSIPSSSATACPTIRNDIVLARDVALDERVADTLLLDARGAGVDLFGGLCRLAGLAQVVDGYIRSVLGEPHGDRLTDAGGAPVTRTLFPLSPRMPSEGVVAVALAGMASF